MPIIPGLKILTSEKQLSSIPRNFYVEVPVELADEVMQHVLDISGECARQADSGAPGPGVPSVYVMQSAVSSAATGS